MKKWVRMENNDNVFENNELVTVKAEDVYEAAEIYESGAKTYICNNVDVSNENIKKLNDIIAEEISEDEDFSISDETELESFLDDNECEHGEIEYITELPASDVVVVFDIGKQQFFDLSKYTTIYSYNYWNGHNHVNRTSETIEEIETEDEAWDIDVWDGHNRTTGGQGLHEEIYIVEKIDGVIVSDTYMLMKTSQYWGSLDTSIIMNSDELKEYLEELGDREDIIEDIFGNN